MCALYRVGEMAKGSYDMFLRRNSKHPSWSMVNADDIDETHITLIIHLLNRVKYHDQNEHLLSQNYRLVDPATAKIIKDKVLR
ncbi:MAG: hypothetical protein ABI091_31295 [Ferruginibacter sp.]